MIKSCNFKRNTQNSDADFTEEGLQRYHSLPAVRWVLDLKLWGVQMLPALLRWTPWPLLAAGITWLIIHRNTELTLQINHLLIPCNPEVSFSHKNAPLALSPNTLPFPYCGKSRLRLLPSLFAVFPPAHLLQGSLQLAMSRACSLRGQETIAHSMASQRSPSLSDPPPFLFL